PATRGRRLLVMGNLALAFVLLVGAGLMLTSVHRLLRVDPGFDAHGVLVMRLSFLAPRYDEEAGIHRAVAAISREVAALPGVEAVGMAGQIPLGGNYDSWGAEVEGRKSDRPQDRLDLQRYAVTPGYRQVMRLPLVAGRWIGDEDRSDTLPVMVLGETAARQLFGAESPLGKRIRIGGPERPWRTVVGVVGDVRHQALSSQVSPQMYLPLEQSTDPFLVMVVRTGGEPTALAPAVRARVVATAQDVPIYGVASLEELAARTAFRESFTSTLLTLFAASALLLASVGLYALVAFLVEARRKEVGVRVALGALRADICRLVLGPGLALVGAGLGLGWLAAVLLSRLLAGLLYEVSPDDPLTYATIAAVLVGTAGLAHLVPLARALGVDPVTTLRED
ncbi:MAG TPA: ABC transporter permease, partial [Thermoanaerobaculia bacterium]|nr:ABC transporter permease [Thermoanaerobaculia bacterium]